MNSSSKTDLMPYQGMTMEPQIPIRTYGRRIIGAPQVSLMAAAVAVIGSLLYLMPWLSSHIAVAGIGLAVIFFTLAAFKTISSTLIKVELYDGVVHFCYPTRKLEAAYSRIERIHYTRDRGTIIIELKDGTRIDIDRLKDIPSRLVARLERRVYGGHVDTTKN